jgi:hypothetical protein
MKNHARRRRALGPRRRWVTISSNEWKEIENTRAKARFRQGHPPGQNIASDCSVSRHLPEERGGAGGLVMPPVPHYNWMCRA